MRSLRLPLAAALAAVAAALPATAAAAPTITEYSSGITAGGAPQDIATAPDGTIWFTEGGLIGRVAKITTSGSVTEFSSGLALGGGPFGITAGADGKMWFTENLLLGSVGRTTLSGTISRFTSGLTLSTGLRHIAAGPDGNLWATSSANPGRIVRTTPAGTITEFSPLSANSQPSGIAAGPDGAMWFTQKANPARVGRITTAGVVTEFALPTAASAPEQIATGPDGNLWFTMDSGIGRITPAGVVTEFTSGVTPGSRPMDIAAGADGNLWFASATNPGRIGRITTTGVVSEYTAGLTTNGAPTGVTAGPDGNIWFTERLGDRIGRITIGPRVDAPASDVVTKTTATVQAFVAPAAQLTSVRVEYGPTPSLGLTSISEAVGSGSSGRTVTIPLTGLVPATTYHYRFVAENASDATVGTAAAFTTLAAPAPPPATGDDPDQSDGPELAPVTPPVAGRKAVAKPVRGVVRITLPGTTTPIPLDEAHSIPVGAVVDATAGRVSIVTSLGADGATQSATFWGGAFTMRQARGDGWVDIHLRSPLRACARPLPAGAKREAAKRPVARSLWAKDAGGKYRTHGRNSVATVRGTTWFTQERCDGTLTRVLEGAVSVRDTVAKRTVLVRGPGRYLARRAR